MLTDHFVSDQLTYRCVRQLSPMRREMLVKNQTKCPLEDAEKEVAFLILNTAL